ncbi:MAG: 4-alpha-glucanotransferase [Tissierellia bacterium]|nr:4-alpha-glucanotransferase [Tissierellia bacterium]
MSLNKRSSGVLLPIFSLPSEYGIGSIGMEAYGFIDFLKGAGQKFWQILPLGPTSYGDSPYQSLSSCAGNPYFIDIDRLKSEDLITDFEIEKFTSRTDSIDYEFLFNNRYKILKIAYSRLSDEEKYYLYEFRQREGQWLEDYALYISIKEVQKHKPWYEWKDEYKFQDSDSIENFSQKYSELIEFHIFTQYEFFKQWNDLKNYANENGIEIIGDLPIYVPYDSVDVWRNPELFNLDEELEPIRVGGVPPDYFNEEGQLWGNPTYDTNVLKNQDYRWWVERLGASFRFVDILRLDHFRGFESFYCINNDCDNAKIGIWEKGLGVEFIDTIKAEFGKDRFIAEDLGFLTEDVRELLILSEFPGMVVLQFGFSPNTESSYLPHNHKKNQIAYLGTHDNDTAIGYYEMIDEEEREYITNYMKLDIKESINWGMIRGLMQSIANTTIIQVQDLIGLGNEARINIPGIPEGNWVWQMKANMLNEDIRDRLYKLTKLYSRV